MIISRLFSGKEWMRCLAGGFPFIPIWTRPPNIESRMRVPNCFCKATPDIWRELPPICYGKRVAAVKIYRVVHQILSPQQILDGLSPEDPMLYIPFFLGEYDAHGDLKNPEDPLIYWLIPITGPDKPIAKPEAPPPLFRARIGASADTRANYLLWHAETCD
jgi:hypothetical protein